MLGIRYMTAAGYDPNGSATMLSQIARTTALEARIQGDQNRSTPEWASTHPLSENRAAQATQIARQTGRVGAGLRNRDAFLAQIKGMIVDDDPAQGVIDGRVFTHPDLHLSFAVPTGYLMQNSTRRVSIQGSGGQAEFAGGTFNGRMEDYVYRVLQQLTGGQAQLQLGPMQRTTVNGIPATYVVGRANTSSGGLDVGVFAYQWDPNTIYHFLTLTRAGQGLAPFATMPIHVTATPTPNQDTATLTRAMATRHIHHRRSMATATGLMASIRTGPITGNATTAAIEHVAGELIRALRYPRGRGKAP